MSISRLLHISWLFFLLLCVASISPAAAEGRCPPGQYPIGDQGVGGCAPIPGAGQSGGNVAPTGRWETRWGAIASDAGHDTSKNAAIGVAESKITEAEARRVALQQCEKLGGTNCSVLLAYHNQCAALAGPNIAQLRSRGGVLNASGAGSLEKARELSIERCEAEKGGQSCILVYSACAVPAFFED